ncbi:MAG: P-loop NTPase, partial [Desulfotomaculaceae bacterium]|nr:P-loop NTPase [Desulfotomaculaceae bacterium]
MGNDTKCNCDSATDSGCSCGAEPASNCGAGMDKKVVDNSKTGIERLAINEFSSVKNVIAVMSGKGGVGKSSVASLLACGFRRKGFEVGILDADITGPSVPRMFGIKGKAEG